MIDEDGYRLWLRYEPVADAARLAQARALCASVYMPATTPMLAAARNELARGLAGLLGATPSSRDNVAEATLIVGTPLGALRLRNEDIDDESPLLSAVLDDDRRLRHRQRAGGRAPRRSRSPASPTPACCTACSISCVICRPAGRSTRSTPPAARASACACSTTGTTWTAASSAATRAGRSGAGTICRTRSSPRYRDYARANASIGINAVALNNVNASAQILTPAYLRKVAALADVFRPWGIRVFLSARFSAPIELGGLPTADPRDARVAAWWRAKADEIYALIPDFGGFLVKANSEGQPGPQDYGRTHADGANMLADALAPHGGVVIWRAFVYKADVAEDRAKQAYAELVPLDGNVPRRT